MNMKSHTHTHICQGICEYVKRIYINKYVCVVIFKLKKSTGWKLALYVVVPGPLLSVWQVNAISMKICQQLQWSRTDCKQLPALDSHPLLRCYYYVSRMHRTDSFSFTCYSWQRFWFGEKIHAKKHKNKNKKNHREISEHIENAFNHH